MTIRTILPFGDELLRKKARPAEGISPRIERLLDDMAETLYATDGRAGLAAPQIGILRRVIVMDCGEGLVELVNPEIVEMSGEQVGAEACLSFPGYAGIVKRANEITITTLNRRGETETIRAEGFLARCIQHEIDHLDGILFIDHVKGTTLFHEENGDKISIHQVRKIAGPPPLSR